MGDDMEKKLREAYARGYYQRGGFPRHVLEDVTAAVLLTSEEIARYRASLAPYSKAQIMKHIKEYDIANVVATDAYVTGAALVEAIHGADRMVCVGAGYSTLCSRLIAERVARYEVFDIETPEILEDKYRRLETSGAETEGICRIELKEGFLEKLRYNKKMFWDITGLSEMWLLEELGKRLVYDSAVVFKHYGDYRELEKKLSDIGFRIYEYSGGKELTDRFFDKANLMTSQYCLKVSNEMNIVLAVKKP